MPAPPDFEHMWRQLAPVGRSASSGGYFRQPWTSAETELRSWFAEQCATRGLAVETDGLGNQVAWWGDADVPGVLTGSHLDSVLDGGAYDGPLGVASALAAVDVLRDRGVTPARPLGIGVFVEEEGSRFGRACLGSRLVTGATTWDEAKELRDRDGVFLADAVADAGLDPSRGLLSLDRVGTFVELHVEQGRDLVDRGAAVGLASEIWPHGRWRFDFRGQANHAGTTRMEDRHDPMLTYAMTALAANKQARLSGERATFGRLAVEPNGTNAVPSLVTAWLDARASSDDALAELVASIERQAGDRAGRDGTSLAVTAESVSGSVAFDPGLAARLAALGDWPVIPTQAGHDAGILSAAGIPTAMVFVRNPTGVSHSPDEHAEAGDCLAGVEALADVLAELTGAPA
ncbi:allantoate amidohydrolase [Nocardioides xinjiangensis]|uniref:allantoate amidohydrolase n=1 Tax=Nocardioides xinjiangensis TaxID=2817376 RepID=UPI001FEDE680|nr:MULTISPECIES: allantoate amidohydrolase [unclassified Nocardioides]